MTFALCLAGAPTYAATHYVDLNSTNPVPPYTNWVTAATDIQSAIDAASDGEIVIVSNGLYDTGGVPVGEGITNRVAVTNAVAVQSVNGPSNTTIAGQGPYGEAAVRCVYLTTGAHLVGFTLTTGRVNESSYQEVGYAGGGCYCATNAVISNCVIRACGALDGGGVAHGIVRDSVITSNACWRFGAGAYASRLERCSVEGNPGDIVWGEGGGLACGTAIDCLIVSNTAYAGGGCAHGCVMVGCTAMYNTATYGGAVSSCTVSNSFLAFNSANRGGAVAFGAVKNTLVYRNTAWEAGGAWQARLENSTVVSNSAQSGGGVAGCEVVNSIVYFNAATVSTSNYWDGSELCGPNVFTNSCTAPQPSGTNNITADPCFVDRASGDFHLHASSPCVDAGTNAPWMSGAVDLDGYPRILYGVVDMGCYELGWDPTPAPTILAPVYVAPGGEEVYVTTDAFAWVEGTKPTGTWVVVADGYGGYATGGIDQVFSDSGWTNGVSLTNIQPVGEMVLTYHCATGSSFPPVGSSGTSLRFTSVGAGPPGLWILGSDPIVVGAATTNLAVCGTNNGHVLGMMWVSNAADGEVQFFTAPAYPETYWTAPAAALGLGTNMLTVCGTNRTGAVSCDVVDVIRATNLDQTVHYVAAGSLCPVPPYLAWSTAATNIPEAVAMATNGHTVIVSNGTYLLSSQIVVASAITLTSVNGAAQTIVDGGRSDRCFYVSQAGAVLDGFTITRGQRADKGGGVYCTAGVVLRDCTILDNHVSATSGASASAGGVYCAGACLVDSCDIAQNSVRGADGYTEPPSAHATGGQGGTATAGGIYCGGGELRHCTIRGNEVRGGTGGDGDDGGAGGGAFGGGVHGSSILITNCFITGNDCRGGDGGDTYWDCVDPPQCNFYEPRGVAGNGGPAAGGGVDINGGSVLQSVIASNDLWAGWPGVWMGYCGQPYGGGIRAQANVEIVACEITHNDLMGTQDGGYGGGASLHSGSRVRDSLVACNVGCTRGLGIYCDSALVENCSVGCNTWTTAFSEGGGIFFAGQSTSRNNIVYFNTSHSASSNWAGSATWIHCCTSPDPGGEGNITNDPSFVDVSGADFHLQPDSPCIDTGTNLMGYGTAFDLDGVPRPLDGNNDGTNGFDMGCFEFMCGSADSDGDALTDSNEVYVLGTDPADIDTDGDRFEDGKELGAETDPLNAASYLGIDAIWAAPDPVTGMVFRWQSATDKVYCVLRATNMLSGLSVLATNIPSTPMENVYTDETAGAATPLFYGVGLDPGP